MIQLNRNSWIHACVLIITITVFTQKSDARPVELNDSITSLSLGLHMEILEDRGKTLTLKNVSRDTRNWTPSSSESPGFGFTDSAYWVRFSVKNTSRSAGLWYLEISYPMLDHIGFHVIDEDGKAEVIEMGDRMKFSARPVNHRNFVVPLTVPGDAVRTCYIRIESESSMNIPLRIWSPRAFMDQNSNEHIIMGLYYGSMMIMIVYNIFLLLGIRYRSYFYYIAFIIGYVLFQMTLNGISFQYLWPDSIWWANACLPFFMLFANIWLQLFNRTFLDSSDQTPRLDMVFQGLIVASVIGMILPFMVKYSISIRYSTFVVLLSVIYMLVYAYYSLLKGYRSARIYVIAWSFFIVGVSVYALKTFGVLPNTFFTNWSIQIGSVSVVVLLSLALADQINILRLEKTSALTTLNEAYSRFVPHEFLRLLEKESVTDIRLGDQIQREITILFSDIRQFTSLSESMTPEENFNFLNSYLKRISPVIRKYNGFIDKFIGDAIMAIFPGSPLDALNASIDIQKELVIYNEHRRTSGYTPISIGIGLHSGSVILGTIGEEQRIDGTVIADAVNLASRIEGLTKTFGTNILISDEIYEVVKTTGRYAFRYLGRVRVRGKNRVIRIYEALDGCSPDDQEMKHGSLEDFNAGIELYHQKRYHQAANHFREVLNVNPGDGAAEFFLGRSQMNVEKKAGLPIADI